MSSRSTKAPRRAARSSSTATAASSPSRSRSSRRSSRSRATSSTIPRRSGRRSSRPRARRCARPASRRRDVAAIGVTNQRETTVLWDKADRQAGRQRDRLAEPRQRADLRSAEGRRPRGAGPRARPAWSSTPISPAPRSSTCSTPSPACARAPTRGEILFGTIDTFLIWRLTGGKAHVTDVSNASRTLLFNIHTLDWDDELLTLLDVPRRDAAGGARRRARSTARPTPSLFGARDPDRRRRRRSAGGAVRPGVLRAGHGEEHLRHRLLHAAQHRRRRRCRRTSGLLTTIAWKIGGEVDLRARRRGVHRRRGGAVAARRPAGDRRRRPTSSS